MTLGNDYHFLQSIMEDTSYLPFKHVRAMATIILAVDGCTIHPNPGMITSLLSRQTIPIASRVRSDELVSASTPTWRLTLDVTDVPLVE
jgi:hypothetical protein